MPTTPATGDTTARTVDEQFLDLICNDADLLAAEFDAIIAAEWPEPPPDRPGTRRRRRAPRQRRSPPRRRPCPRPGLPATTPRHRRMGTAALTPAPTPDPRQTGRQVIATREPTRTR